MPRLLVCSDLHLEFCRHEVPTDAVFDIAVLAGDIMCPGSNTVRWAQHEPALRRARAVLCVPGNHEYYDSTYQAELARMRSAAAGSHVHVLDCDRIVIDGVRFLGCTLWTDFELRIDTPEGPRSDRSHALEVAHVRMVDYRAIQWFGRDPAGGTARQRPLTPDDTLRLHAAHRRWLEAALAEPFNGPTVVVTHHGPHRGSLAALHAADWISAAYLSELPASLFEVPVLWVHGHTHASADYRIGGCRIVCNPRGYWTGRAQGPENPAFDPALCIEVRAAR